MLVAGESLVDLVPAAGGMLVPLPGGGPCNVARGVARLGARCAFLSAISRDRLGGLLREQLAADGVDATCLVDSDLPTALALAELDGGGAAQYRFYVEGTAAAALSPAAALAAVAGLAPYALHVGTLGLALEPLGDAVEQVVAAMPDATIVTVDPNWRPGAFEDASRWRARLDRVLARADLVKASIEDLAHLAPGLSVQAAARALLRERTRCVLVTDGDGDVRVLTGEGEALVSPPRVEVLDTVGAGDAFCAGVLASCAAGEVPRDALGSLPAMTDAARFAALVAARACERPGADPPRRDELAGALGAGAAPRGVSAGHR